MAAGKINLQANDGKVAGIVFEDGASGNVAVTVPKNGGKLAADSTVVHKTGDETIAGVKTFSNNAIFNSNVSIGTNSPIALLHSSVGVGNALALNGGSYKGLSVLTTNTNASTDGGLKIKQISNGSIVSALEFQGSDNGSGILLLAGGNVERMRIDSSGNVLVTGSGGLGYGTGSGGTVTQLTSKSTAVTLNKPTGKINMNNASLAAGASVSFTFTNTTMTNPYDILLLQCLSLNTASYELKAIGYGANDTVITVKNVSGGALSEALVLNFAVVKGAIA